MLIESGSYHCDLRLACKWPFTAAQGANSEARCQQIGAFRSKNADLHPKSLEDLYTPPHFPVSHTGDVTVELHQQGDNLRYRYFVYYLVLIIITN